MNCRQYNTKPTDPQWMICIRDQGELSHVQIFALTYIAEQMYSPNMMLKWTRTRKHPSSIVSTCSLDCVRAPKTSKPTGYWEISIFFSLMMSCNHAFLTVIKHILLTPCNLFWPEIQNTKKKKNRWRMYLEVSVQLWHFVKVSSECFTFVASLQIYQSTTI